MKKIDNSIFFNYKDKTYNYMIEESAKNNCNCQNIYMDNFNAKVDDITRVFVLQLTKKCNMGCKYCVFGESINVDSDKDMIINLLNYIQKMGLKNVKIAFFGGEPLIKFDLIKFVLNKTKELTNIDWKFSIYTNGLLLNEEISRYLYANNVNIILSLDGTKEMHDNNRIYKSGNPTYEEVVLNFKKNKKYMKNIIVNSVYDTKKMNETFVNITENLYNEGFGMFSLKFPYVEFDSEYSLNEQKLNKVKQYVDEYMEYSLGKIQEKRIDYIFFHNVFQYILFMILGKSLKCPYGCQVGKIIRGIDTGGNIYPCQSFIGIEEFKVGNIKEIFFENNTIERFRNYSYEGINKCNTCPIEYICSSSCAYECYLYNNDIYKPNKFRCDIEKEFFKAAVILYSEIKKYPDLVTKIKIAYSIYQGL